MFMIPKDYWIEFKSESIDMTRVSDKVIEGLEDLLQMCFLPAYYLVEVLDSKHMIIKLMCVQMQVETMQEELDNRFMKFKEHQIDYRFEDTDISSYKMLESIFKAKKIGQELISIEEKFPRHPGRHHKYG